MIGVKCPLWYVGKEALKIIPCSITIQTTLIDSIVWNSKGRCIDLHIIQDDILAAQRYVDETRPKLQTMVIPLI